LDGAATSASAKPRGCSPTWRRGSAEDYARIFGDSGRMGTTASMNCAVVAYRRSMQRSPPVRPPGSGICRGIRRSNRPCATTTSTHSVFPDSMSLFQLNPVEPPRYATRMPGGVGGVAPRGVPLSLRQPSPLTRRWPRSSIVKNCSAAASAISTPPFGSCAADGGCQIVDARSDPERGCCSTRFGGRAVALSRNKAGATAPACSCRHCERSEAISMAETLRVAIAAAPAGASQ
jgi:hypothetical protein